MDKVNMLMLDSVTIYVKGETMALKRGHSYLLPTESCDDLIRAGYAVQLENNSPPAPAATDTPMPEARAAVQKRTPTRKTRKHHAAA